ncbi:hypothetical protein ACH5RR_006079 [Cinchona calisaya]|uniref:Uncharacterized protein n=1 Tax=Cinchona calisaya TaxID=153742 RepID=A0ABD3AMY9_9GENT
MPGKVPRSDGSAELTVQQPNPCWKSKKKKRIEKEKERETHKGENRKEKKRNQERLTYSRGMKPMKQSKAKIPVHENHHRYDYHIIFMPNSCYLFIFSYLYILFLLFSTKVKKGCRINLSKVQSKNFVSCVGTHF